MQSLWYCVIVYLVGYEAKVVVTIFIEWREVYVVSMLQMRIVDWWLEIMELYAVHVQLQLQTDYSVHLYTLKWNSNVVHLWLEA